MKYFFVGAMLLALAGCSSSYKQNELMTPNVKLNPSVGVLISTPQDGKYNQIEYHNSGNMTANAVRSSFVKNAHNVAITSACDGKSCLDSLDNHVYGYYVQPVILHWEDRATEWSGRPDRIEIQLIIYDTQTKQEIANTTYSGKSKWASLGGDHPQDLLDEPTSQFIDSLYR